MCGIKRNIMPQRGSVLFLTMFLLSLAAVAAGSLLVYTRMLSRTEERKLDNLRALYIAESGVHQIIHFFNKPDDYGPDSTLFIYDRINDEFPNLDPLIAALTSDEDFIPIPEIYWPSFNLPDDSEFGEVTFLGLFRPQSPPDPDFSTCRVKSVGVTRDGAVKTIIATLGPGIPGVYSPAGLISKYALKGYDAAFLVRWGETWSDGPLKLPVYNKETWENFVDVDDPGWTRAIATEYLYQGDLSTYVDGSKPGSETPIPYDPSYPDPTYDSSYYNPCRPVCELQEFTERLLQHWELDFPEFDYYRYKQLAKRKGEYYVTDSDGQLYRDGIIDAEHLVSSFVEEFSGDTADPYRFVFIDTIDGLLPAPDGSNLADILISATLPEVHLKGFFYINANIKLTGSGSNPTVEVLMPDENPYSIGGHGGEKGVWLDGVMYFTGDLDATGNATVYGSLISEGEITVHGNPAVFYNYLLATGEFFPITSVVYIYLFNVI